VAREERVKASICHRMNATSSRIKRRFVETEDGDGLLDKWARMDL